jgi:hypothetical protein
MGFARLSFVPVVAASLMAVAQRTSAGDLPSTFAGNLLGYVADSLGTPQMGASVLLYDRYDRLVRKTLTASDGRFGFPGLTPSLYSVKVSVPLLLPASRDKIAVRAGSSSVLQIRMAAIFSSVELQYTKPTAAMSDDWKWVLRTSTATRVITRELPTSISTSGKSTSPENPQKIFTDTRGLVSLSAGDAGSLLSDVGLADFGTSFALATTLYGRNKLTLSGAFGQSIGSGMPTMGVRATYARADDEGLSHMPEITIMAEQVSLPNRAMNYTGPDGNPAVRSTALSYYDTMDVLNTVHLEYGASVDSIGYVNHVTRTTPFGRATVSLGKVGSFSAAFSSGTNPNELYIHQFGDETDLVGTANALSSLPGFSLRDGHLAMQRTQNTEIGYSKVVGRRTYAVSGFYEDVKDGRVNVAGSLSGLNQSDVIPDVSTDTSIYNVGHYTRHGVVGSLNQKIDDNLELTVAVGAMGGFTRPGVGEGLSEGADQQLQLERRNHLIASIGGRATLPVLNMRIMGNYEYVGADAMIPRHIFSTQRLYAEPGLNIMVRQPLPSFFGCGKLELSADLRNLLAQGYLPLAAVDGHRTLLVQSPRAVRGGLNIIF